SDGGAHGAGKAVRVHRRQAQRLHRGTTERIERGCQMKTFLPVLGALLASACATQKCPPPETKVEYVPQRVEVTVPIRCRVAFPAHPAYALEDPTLKDKTS